uniref:Uncharacterized protein n=1 Tax=Ananas comosus var. bracteatus TaxID=296719 RepID=A0A6V7PPX6_ANACO|nr:unnamed protein product [Ananas comosus var. bracteatus]
MLILARGVMWPKNGSGQARNVGPRGGGLARPCKARPGLASTSVTSPVSCYGPARGHAVGQSQLYQGDNIGKIVEEIRKSVHDQIPNEQAVSKVATIHVVDAKSVGFLKLLCLIFATFASLRLFPPLERTWSFDRGLLEERSSTPFDLEPKLRLLERLAT